MKILYSVLIVYILGVFSLLEANTFQTYFNDAVKYTQNGDYKKAIVKSNEALKQLEYFPENHDAKIMIYIIMAKACEALGEYDKAINYSNNAFKINEQFGKTKNKDLFKTFIYNNFASTYIFLGDYLKSIEYSIKAINIQEEILDKNDFNLSISYNIIGITYMYMKDYDNALEYLLKSLKIKEDKVGKTNPSTGITYNNVGLVYLEIKEYNKSLEYFKNALKTMEGIMEISHPDIGAYYSNIGESNYFLGNYSLAIEYLNKGLNIFKSLDKNHPHISSIYHKLALVHQSKKEYNDSYINIRKAYDIFLINKDKNFSSLDNSQKNDYLKKNKEIISSLFDISYDYSNTNRHLKEQVSKDAFNSLLNTKGSLYDSENLITMLYENSKDPKIKSMIEYLSKEKRELAKLYQTIPKDGMDKYKEDIDLKENSITEIEQELSKNVSSFQDEIGLKYIYSSDILKSLKDNELYIDYVYTDKNYYILTIDSKDKIGFYKIDENNSKIIDNSVNEFHKHLESFYNNHLSKDDIENESAKSKDILKTLFLKALYEPIGKVLDNYVTFIISADGALRLLPFEAMINLNNKYLIEDKNISYIPSGKEFVRLTKYGSAKNSNKVDVFANPDFDLKQNLEKKLNTKNTTIIPNNTRASINKSLFKMKFSELPGTKEELNSIRNILGGNIQEYSSSNANESNLLKVSNPKILHIATHGFFLNDDTLPNPMLKSGIVLSGANTSAKLGIDEGIVTSLKLSGLKLKGTELVVLSACQTGVVDKHSTDNVSGLNKAFIQAGANNVMMSLWTVADKETKELMTDFYKNSKKNKDYSLALKQSKLNMIKQNLHPYYWAPFIISGKYN